MEGRQYKIGDLVIVKESFCGSTENAMGYVYETYEDKTDPGKKGVMIFLEDGLDLCGFSYEEQQQFLIFIGESPIMFRLQDQKVVESFIKEGMHKIIFQNLTQPISKNEIAEIAKTFAQKANLGLDVTDKSTGAAMVGSEQNFSTIQKLKRS